MANHNRRRNISSSSIASEKKMMNEKNKRFLIALIIAFVVVGIIAYWDVLSMQSGVLGSPYDYMNGNFTKGWATLFYSFADFLMILVPVCYFFFYRRDFSEAIAIFLTEKILLLTGTADVLFFWLQGQNIPLVLPWLTNHITIGKVTSLLGYAEANPISLLITAAMGILLAYGLAWILKEKF